MWSFYFLGCQVNLIFLIIEVTGSNSFRRKLFYKKVL
jgi:hypothetical protein